jgi:NADH dehydrogenase (ubiquinone) Fe-S protein 2
VQSIKSFNINFGPQHPAAHGVIRIIITITGEVVIRAEPHIGLLHRGTEKLIEYKTCLQAIPYFDRLDYVSMLANEHTFSLAVEKAAQTLIPLRTQYIRVLLLELTRILNHLMSITTHAMDVGALTPFLWAFEEREKLMEFYERLSGARMHANFIRPGGLSFDLPIGLCSDIYNFLLQFNSRLDELEELLTTNRIWKNRLLNVGIVSQTDAINYNFSGVIIRGTGLRWDIRKTHPYEVYSYLNFSVPVGKFSDCYDRYLIRMHEMRESAAIMFACLQNLSYNLEALKINDYKFFAPSKTQMKQSMEDLIHHFRYFTKSTDLAESCLYASTEAPKGEFGDFLVTNGTNKPYR